MQRFRLPSLLLLLLPLLAAPSVCGAREYLQVFVTEPYLELRTGPGRGFPVTQVVPRSESVDVLKRRTDYFKVRTERGIEGWASQKDMQKVVLADGTPFTFPLGDRAGFTSHRVEGGIFARRAAYGSAFSAREEPSSGTTIFLPIIIFLLCLTRKGIASLE